MIWRLRHAVAALFGIVACGGGDDSGGGSSSSSSATPDELCAERCQLEVDAGCAKMPPDYLTSCTAICLAKYTKYPSCEPALHAYDLCTVERVTYGCANDTIDVMPTGGCAAEGAGCLGCTGDLFGCL